MTERQEIEKLLADLREGLPKVEHSFAKAMYEQAIAAYELRLTQLDAEGSDDD